MGKKFLKLLSVVTSFFLAIFLVPFSVNNVKADILSDDSLFGEVLVSDTGTSPTIQNGNTSRKLAVATDGTIYATYHCTEGVKVAKSTDRGQTFQASVLAYNVNVESEIAVSTDGTVYLSWVESDNIKLVKSTDGGATFSAPITVGASSCSSVHMATDGNYVYIIDQLGKDLWRSTDCGSTFSSVHLCDYDFVFSDVHVDPTTHKVIVQEDNPSIKYYISENNGETFGEAIIPAEQAVFYSVGSIGSDLTGHYLLIAGQFDTGVKINLDTGAVTNPDFGYSNVEQGRTLSDDAYGNMATGYSDGSNVYLKVSNDLGSTFAAPITVAASTVANASINTTNGDILFLYERDGQVYLKVYGNMLVGYSLAVSNSSLYFDADNNELSRDVTITNTSSGPLDINSITATGDFTIDSSEVGATLAVGESATVKVHFNPTVIGTSLGNLTINYGDPAQEKIVNLSGYISNPLVTSSITYNLNGGINNSANVDTYVEGVGLTLQAPTKTNYTFGGWYDNADFTGSAITEISTTDIGDKIVYAKWKKVSISPAPTPDPTPISTPESKTLEIIETPKEIKNPEKISVKPVGEAFDKSVEVRMKDDSAVKKVIEETLTETLKEKIKDVTIFPLDISFYIKGTDTKVQPNEGTSVIITCPISENLLASKDNIKMVCLIDGKLNILPSEVVLIDNVYCVQFTATHFSPYAMVVDAANVVNSAEISAGAGMLEYSIIVNHYNVVNSVQKPETEDNSSVIPFALVAIISATTLAIIIKKSKFNHGK